MDLADVSGNFANYTGYRREAVNTVGGKNFKVRLEAGSRTGITAGNGEDNGNGRSNGAHTEDWNSPPRRASRLRVFPCITCGFMSCVSKDGVTPFDPYLLVNPAPSELPGLEVSVDDVMYMPSLDAPADRPFPFVYFITIRNLSKITVTVKARKWVVKQRNGEIIVVEGDGVVGQFPRLEPGGEFTYNSCHTISQDSEATGAYFAEADDSRQYFVRIPPFLMELPQWV